LEKKKDLEDAKIVHAIINAHLLVIAHTGKQNEETAHHANTEIKN
jgi:hypothetical protein